MYTTPAEIATLTELGLTAPNLATLQFLTDNQDRQIEEFKLNFWRGRHNQASSITAYRKHKLNTVRITKVNFFSMCVTRGLKETVENLIQYPVSDYELTMLEKKLISGEITLDTLYDNHKESPLSPLARLF